MADSSVVRNCSDVNNSESAVDVGVQPDDASPKVIRLLVEEASSLDSAPVHVRNLVRTLGENPDPADVTMALIIVLMVEAGFRTERADAKTSRYCTFDVRAVSRLGDLPAGWRQPERSCRYELPMWLCGRPDVECRLVGSLTSNSDTLLVTLLAAPDRPFTIAAQPAYAADQPWPNIKVLCHRVKDSLAAQTRSHLLWDTPGLHPGLMGLPDELILRICKFLSAEDLGRLSCVNRDLNELANDVVLWRRLFHIKFPEATDPDDGQFRKSYVKELEEERRRSRVCYDYENYGIFRLEDAQCFLPAHQLAMWLRAQVGDEPAP